MKLNVIITGATGMVGEGVLHEAILDPNVSSILVIGRTSCSVSHPKVHQLVHRNFFDFSTVTDLLHGFNACFFCLGVSSIGMKEAEYTRITHDLTLHVAETLVKLNPEMTFCYVSGAGTDSTAQGRSMWARVKGKTENDLRRLPFRAAYMFRPGFIRPTKGLQRAFLLARIVGAGYPVIHTLFGKYVCTLEEVGRAMINVSKDGYEKPVLECIDIQKAGARS